MILIYIYISCFVLIAASAGTIKSAIENKILAEEAATFTDAFLHAENVTSIEKLTQMLGKIIPRVTSITPLNSSSSSLSNDTGSENNSTEYEAAHGLSLPSIDARGANVNVQVVVAGSNGCCQCGILSAFAPSQADQLVSKILSLVGPTAEVLASLPTTEAEASSPSPPPTLLNKLGIKTKAQLEDEAKHAAVNTAYAVNALFPSIASSAKGKLSRKMKETGGGAEQLQQILSSLLSSSGKQSDSGSVNLNPISITTNEAPSNSKGGSKRCCPCN